jgi:predicted lipid-binding transport protein (Tim44 family)
MDLDIVIYAIIAALILARLWTLFGRRNDDEPQRPNPFITPASRSQEDENVAPDPTKQRMSQLLKLFQTAPASLAGGLEQIKMLDPSFDEKQFLQGARAAFTIIVEDFAKGELGRITRLLGPDVLPHFKEAIEARRQAGQTMENKIARIRDVETTAARVEDACAFITVRFVSEQENVLRDAHGTVIGGSEGKLEEITDHWIFSRDTKSTDPNWILAETKS